MWSLNANLNRVNPNYVGKCVVNYNKNKRLLPDFRYKSLTRIYSGGSAANIFLDTLYLDSSGMFR